jgi:hypothetical protein
MDKELIAHAIEQANKPLIQALGQVKAQLHTIARLQMLDALYERSEARALVAELQGLLQRDHAAWRALMEPGVAGSSSQVDRMNARQAASKAVDEFTARHPLIADLVNGSGPKHAE